MNAIQVCIFWLPAVFIAMRYVVNPMLRKMAWQVSVSTTPNVQDHPGQHTNGWALWGQSPGFDARGWYMFATHTPIYLVKTVYALYLFVPLAVQWYLEIDPLNKIKDEAVFDYCTKTSLVILTKFESEDNDNYVFEMDPKRMPSSFAQVGNCDPNTLRIVFNARNGKVIEAISKNGPVMATKTVGRNEILVVALRNINAIWVHPTIHVGAEKNALEIQSKRINMLEPSAHFVSSLHDGLLHGPFGPLNQNSPLYAGSGSPEDVVANSFSHPVPPHVIDKRKLQFDTYKFLVTGRKEIYHLVRKYQLNVDAEFLFMNLVMHEIDHECVYEILSKLPLCSVDASGSLFSCWKNHAFCEIWVQHWDQPTSSDLITSNLDNPFYAELYSAMSKVNKERADQMVVSCCF